MSLLNSRIAGFVATAIVAAGMNAFAAEAVSVSDVVGKYCLSCHDADSAKGGLNLAAVPVDDVSRQPEVWEKVVRRLRGRQMPPAGKRRPDDNLYAAVVGQLERDLDRA